MEALQCWPYAMNMFEMEALQCDPFAIKMFETEVLKCYCCSIEDFACHARTPACAISGRIQAQ
jgi:hypothetical protein